MVLSDLSSTLSHSGHKSASATSGSCHYFAFLILSLAARRHHDSGRNHQCEGGGDHQGDPGLSQLQEVAHQHAGAGEGERCDQRALLRRHALPQVDTLPAVWTCSCQVAAPKSSSQCVKISVCFNRDCFVSGNSCLMASGMRSCSSFNLWSAWTSSTGKGVFTVSTRRS